MSLESKYQPNREVLERFVEFVKREGTTRTDRIVPTVEQLGQIVETVFWASLLEEEGHQVYPALKVFDSKPPKQAFYFGTQERLEPTRLAKLCPALVSGMYFGVSFKDSEPEIWGMGHGLGSDVVVEAIDAGVVILSYYQPFAIFRRDRVEVISPNLQERAMGPLYRAVGGYWPAKALLGIVRIMENLHRGGTLILVQEREGQWRNDVELSKESNPPYEVLSYAVKKYHEGLVSDNSERYDAAVSRGLWIMGEKALSWAMHKESATETVAQLTTVDGAVFLDRELRVISFGAKLMAPNDVTKVNCWSPIEGVGESSLPLGKIGGTRHQSAVRFVAKTTDAVAVVVSQDGPVSIVAWNEKEVAVSITRHAELLLYGRRQA